MERFGGMAKLNQKYLSLVRAIDPFWQFSCSRYFATTDSKMQSLCRRVYTKRIPSAQLCSRFLSQGKEGDEGLTVCTQENGIRRIVLNNPKKRNALSLSMLTAIRSNLLHNVDCDLRVIILSANGGVFSSGHDLKELVRQLVLVVVSNLFMTQCSLPLMILVDEPIKLHNCKNQ